MGRRTVLLIVAVLVALLGVLLVLLYVRGIDNRAREGQETVEVLYTKNAIALGTTGSDAQSAGAFESRVIPKDAVASGAISSVDPIATQTALVAIPAGVPVTTAQWGQPGSSAALPIPGDRIAVSVQLGDPQRVAGFVEPGSEVAVFITRTASGGNGPTTNVLLPRVQVIAVGPTTTTTTQTSAGGTTNTEEVSRAILTLALTQKQAEQTILGQSVGELYLGLLTDKSRTAQAGRTGDGNLG